MGASHIPLREPRLVSELSDEESANVYERANELRGHQAG
jgi:hypothetical protein